MQNTTRAPGLALGNAQPLAMGPPSDGEVARDERFGGLLKHFCRKAA